jgi:hypothetical protein
MAVMSVILVFLLVLEVVVGLTLQELTEAAHEKRTKTPDNFLVTVCMVP